MRISLLKVMMKHQETLTMITSLLCTMVRTSSGIIFAKFQDLNKKFQNETQGPRVFFFTLLVMLRTMNLLALLP